jgi:hypothetical protein
VTRCNVDEDCDGLADDDDSAASGKTKVYEDGDGDAYGDAAVSLTVCDAPSGYVADSTDCDDSRATVNPGATEVCDSANLDEDCDGKADDADSAASGKTTGYADDDGDTYGDASAATTACDLPSGSVSNSTDCDDNNAAINPAATEVCDSANTDEDCDGKADDADSSASGKSTWYGDADGDSYGASASSSTACDQPSGSVSNSTDCDDTKSSVNPGAAEVCDASNTDEDCDGKADDNDTSVSASGKTTYYRDADSDTYGNASVSSTVCDLPTGYVTNDDDCDDTKSSINPAATEVCDASNTDEDCDGKADDNDTSASGKSTWYRDVDGDTYGSSSTTSSACDQPSGYVSLSADCDDTKASINPAAAEVCDSLNTDEDCDGLADDLDSSASGKTTVYRDADSDSYGSAATTKSVCDSTSGYVSNDDDCDDTSAAVSPADAEVCDDGIDNDCDGSDETCSVPGYSGVYDVNSGYDVKIYGAAAADHIAEVVIGGDFNGDGLGDMIIGSSDVQYTSYDGQLFGYYGPFTAGAQTPTTNDDFGHYANTSAASTYFGGYVVNIGDLDNDGDDDYAAMADNSYRLYNLYQGGATTTRAHTLGVLGSFTCTEIAGAGQFYATGGMREIVCADSSSSSNTGKVSIHEGTASSASVTFTGEALGDYAGWDADGGGDVDGDGYDDFIAGAPYNDAGGSSAGAVYLVYGLTTGTATFASADAKIIGDAANDYLGGYLNLIGDADSDGRDDMLISAADNDVGGASAGAVYLITNPSAGRAAAVAEAVIVGASAGDSITETAMDMGDVDGDGTLDLVVGAFQHDNGSASDAGALWVIYGPISGSYDLTTDGDAKWASAYAADYVAASFALIPDADGDGDVEIAVGSAYHDYGSGSSYASLRGAVWIWPGM